MVALDRILGFAELVLVPVSLILLITALYKEKGRRRAITVTLLTGLTVAQPFGIVSHLERSVPPASAAPVDPNSVHVVRLLGVPVLPFDLYVRPDMSPFPQENVPTETLRARSWFWGPLLTNSAKLADTCGDVTEPPCASTLDRKLHLLREGNDYWITIPNRGTCRPAAGIPCSFRWRLEAGVTSWIGVGYWLVAAAVLVPVVRRLRARRQWDRTEVA